MIDDRQVLAGVLHSIRRQVDDLRTQIHEVADRLEEHERETFFATLRVIETRTAEIFLALPRGH